MSPEELTLTETLSPRGRCHRAGVLGTSEGPAGHRGQVCCRNPWRTRGRSPSRGRARGHSGRTDEMTSAHAGSRGSQLPGSGSPRTSPCQEWGGVSGLCCGSDTVGLDIATAAHAARPAGLLLQSPVRVHRCPPGAPGKTPRTALLPAGFPGGWRGRARRSGWTVLGSRPAAELQRPAEPQPQGGLRQPQPTASAWGSPQRGHLQRGLAPFGAVPRGQAFPSASRWPASDRAPSNTLAGWSPRTARPAMVFWRRIWVWISGPVRFRLRQSLDSVVGPTQPPTRPPPPGSAAPWGLATSEKNM